MKNVIMALLCKKAPVISCMQFNAELSKTFPTSEISYAAELMCYTGSMNEVIKHLGYVILVIWSMGP